MKILITGADGFVGSHLVRLLVRDVRIAIVGIARTTSGIEAPNYRELACDLSSTGFPSALPPDTDVVIHLAQSRGYRDFPNAAADLFAVNVAATARLLEWSRTKEVKRFIFASTGNVYRPSRSPLKETDPCDPVSFYGATKLAAETLIRQYSCFFETTTLRIFGVYGPGQRRMIVSDMIAKVRGRSEITLPEGRGFVFSPIYITDCVKVVEQMLHQTDPKQGSVYNLGGTEYVDLKRIVETLGRHLAMQPNVLTTSTSATYLLGDSSKVFSKIGFTPQVGIERGLELTVDASN